MPDTHDNLKGVTQLVPLGSSDDDGPAEGAPYELESWLTLGSFEIPRSSATYYCEGLNTEHKWIGGQIARVGECILLPQLAEETLVTGKTLVVEDEVSCGGVRLGLRGTKESRTHLRRNSGGNRLRE